MSKENREIAVRYLVAGIYEGRISKEVVEEKKMAIVLKEFPQI